MPERLILYVRWAALAALVLSIALIVARLKLPMPHRRSKSLLDSARDLWRALREHREDARAHADDLRSVRGKRALLVDPDEKSARVMQWRLRDLHCSVVRVQTGTQGLVRARAGEFDFAIVDALLTDMSARDFYHALGRPEMPVVFVGVLTANYDEIRSLSPKVACLGKPYDPDEAAAIAGYLMAGGDDGGRS